MNKLTFLISGINGKNGQSISEKLLMIPGSKPIQANISTGIYVFVVITELSEEAVSASAASAISGTGASIMSCRVESF